MSLKEKAAEIKAAGEAERGNFTPTGVPMRMWKYWAKHSRHAPTGKENFCHFWRVVAIWAPLMFFRKQLVWLLESPITWVLLIGGAVSALAYSAVEFGFLPIIVTLLVTFACVCYVLGGLFLGTIGGYDEWDDWNDNQIKWAKVGGAVTFSIFLPTFAIGRFIKRKPVTAAKTGLALIILLAASVVIGFGVLVVIGSGWLTLLSIIGFVVGFVAIVIFFAAVVFPAIGEFIQGRRSLALQKSYNEPPKPPKPVSEKVVKVKPHKFRNWLRRFAYGTGDLFIFTTQVARVNKWKICPLVDIKPPQTYVVNEPQEAWDWEHA